MTVQQIAGRVAAPPGLPGTGPPPSAAPGAPSFADALSRAQEPHRLAVSAHAAERLAERGIDLDAVRPRIETALDALDAKGARDALLLGDDAAFIVSVPNRTLVTALSPSELGERVVTQIDSAAFL